MVALSVTVQFVSRQRICLLLPSERWKLEKMCNKQLDVDKITAR